MATNQNKDKNENQEEVNDLVGSLNASEGLRFSSAHTYIDLIVKGNQANLKPGETVVVVPEKLVPEVEELVKKS